jgi:hypothetical protein
MGASEGQVLTFRSNSWTPSYPNNNFVPFTGGMGIYAFTYPSEPIDIPWPSNCKNTSEEKDLHFILKPDGNEWEQATVHFTAELSDPSSTKEITYSNQVYQNFKTGKLWVGDKSYSVTLTYHLAITLICY